MLEKMLFTLLTAGCALAAGLLHAEDIVRMNPEGDLRIGKTYNMYWVHSGPNWSTNKRMNRTTLIPRPLDSRGGETTLSGRFVVAPGQEFNFKSTLKELTPSAFRYRAEFRSEKEIPTGLLFLSMDVPVGTGFRPVIDGRECVMPETYKKLTVFDTKKVHSVQFQAGGQTIELKGDFDFRIQDNRRYRKNTYNVRITPAKASGKLRESDFTCEILSIPLKSTPIRLAKSANMGFADKVAGDGKGGWTDQGSKEDLACMPLGKQTFGGLDFFIQDPAKNNGKSCIVLSKNRPFPPVAPLEVGATEVHPYLYILSATAWNSNFKKPVGHLILTYQDNSTETVPVLCGIDTGNWWRPTMSYPNGLLVWTGNNANGRVGLFAAAVPLRKKPLKQIRFTAENGVWMIAGLSFASRRLERVVEKPLVFQADREWKAFETIRDIVPGSPLDLSATQHRPAGKYGFVTRTADGHFSFEKAPEKRIRFHGTNLCQNALFPDKREAEWIAKTLAATGYNSIRLHQFENGLRNYRSNNTLDFNPVNLDRFDYLIAQLLKHGLYVCADIYVGRPVLPGDNIKECQKGGPKERKILNFVSESAMDNWKEYAKRLLTHKNPYTGRSLLEEPGFYSVNLDNEAPFPSMWDQIPSMVSVVENAYRADLKKRGITDEKAGAKRGADFREFLFRRQRLTQKEQMDYVKKTLGAKLLVTNLNNESKPSYQPARTMLDFTDAHVYHDHPMYPQGRWSLPAAYHQKSSISELGSALHGQAAIRLPNTPHTVTELNFCSPNRFRTEGAPLTGAVAALQSWDGVYRFAFTHNIKYIRKASPLTGFDTIHDPIHTLGERIVYYLYLRGDVRSAPEHVFFPIPETRAPEKFPDGFGAMCLYTGIGSTVKPGEVRFNPPESFRRAMEEVRKTRRVRSVTGELDLDADVRTFRIVTPKSEVFTLNKGAIDGKFAKVKDVNVFSTIALHAQDDRPLTESGKILLLHLTNAVNTGMRFQTDQMNILENNGTLPSLLRNGTAELELAVGNNFAGRIETLAPNGKITGTIPWTRTQNGIRFRISIDGKNGVTPAYRIVR